MPQALLKSLIYQRETKQSTKTYNTDSDERQLQRCFLEWIIW